MRVLSCVVQEYLLTPPDQLMQVLMGVIKAHMAAEPDSFKVRDRRAGLLNCAVVMPEGSRAVPVYTCTKAQLCCHRVMSHYALCRFLVQVIVFFPTARAAQFHAALARASGCEAYDLHSRLSQKQRDTASAAFGKSPTAVMFASDVIARGLDFPDVSLVVQVSFEWSSGRGVGNIGTRYVCCGAREIL